MNSLLLEVTNHCNFACTHCSREKGSQRQHMSWRLFCTALDQATELGLRGLSITGGEPLVWPHFTRAVKEAWKRGFSISLVTNGWLFESRLLSLLKANPKHRNQIAVCFSLDGGSASVHDSFRNKPGSFNRIIKALQQCKELGVLTSIKSALWRHSITQIHDTAMLALSLGAKINFVFLTPTSRLIEMNLIPSPQEYERAKSYLTSKIMPLFQDVGIEGACSRNSPIPLCNPIWSGPNIAYDGEMTFCCNLSNMSEGGQPVKKRGEYIGNLATMSLQEGIYRNYRLLARFVESLVPIPDTMWKRTCIFCQKMFGKMNWLKKYDSPWTELVWNRLP